MTSTPPLPRYLADVPGSVPPHPLLRRFFTLKPVRDQRVTPTAAVLAAVAVVAVQVLDASSTAVGLALGGAEANPTMAALLAWHGLPGFFALKLTSGAWLAWATWRRPSAATSVVLVFAAVTVWNLASIFRSLPPL